MVWSMALRRADGRTSGGSRLLRVSSLRLTACLVLTAVAVAGCASLPFHRAMTEEQSEMARIPGYPQNVRFWGDDLPEDIVEIIRERYDQVAKRLEANGDAAPDVDPPAANMLALSGGADDGAYGAGLLVGWSEAGDRPQFELVSGVSTGALIAPFAFLGSDYDAELERVYTTLSSDQIFLTSVFDALSGIISGASLADTRPLRNQIERQLTQDVLDAIGEEHRKGRRLLVGTTNLEAQRPVIWNIGAIAASGRPDRLRLFHDVILASASIPGVFPPVVIRVDSQGDRFSEIHVDGGVTRQVFLYPTQLNRGIMQEAGAFRETRRLWVIRNTRVLPQYQKLEPNFFSLSGRSVSSLIKSQGTGDIFRLYVLARRDGLDFNLAFVPDEFDAASQELFDPVYMRALFDLGYQRARNGYPWKKRPPGIPDGSEPQPASLN